MELAENQQTPIRFYFPVSLDEVKSSYLNVMSRIWCYKHLVLFYRNMGLPLEPKLQEFRVEVPADFNRTSLISIKLKTAMASLSMWFISRYLTVLLLYAGSIGGCHSSSIPPLLSGLGGNRGSLFQKGLVKLGSCLLKKPSRSCALTGVPAIIMFFNSQIPCVLCVSISWVPLCCSDWNGRISLIWRTAPQTIS